MSATLVEDVPQEMEHIVAVVLDLDGVITRTAQVHAKAWKQTFDELRQHRLESGYGTFRPFDPHSDYLKHVDGKPRYDGVRDFLRSRAVEIPEGHESDPPGMETIHSVGNRKNDIYRQLLRVEKPEVFEDAVRAIRAWRAEGKKIAVASSSRNCFLILRTAKLLNLFDARVDGTHLERWHLPGKPAPDLFLAACRLLGARPEQSMVIEDAISGIQAGRRGGFGKVVGVARFGESQGLMEAGADIVVRSLEELLATKKRKAAS